jgi:hypothetical protein
MVKLDKDKISKVKRSYAKCFLGKGDIVETFYEILYIEQPQYAKIVTLSPAALNTLFRVSMNGMLLFAEESYAGKVAIEDIKDQYLKSKTSLGEKLHPIIKKCLLESLEKHDPDFNLEVYKLWNEVIDESIDFLTHR